jgi:signal transduction histidine kinase/ActR/RegA family two-component response regulator
MNPQAASAPDKPTKKWGWQRVLAGLFSMALVLLISALVLRDNQHAQSSIKQVEELHMGVSFELARLLNSVNSASAAQRVFFDSGDTLFESKRMAIWTNQIDPWVAQLKQKFPDLPPEDTAAISLALFVVTDYKIIQEELHLFWEDMDRMPRGPEKTEAKNKLNERLLEWAATGRDELGSVLIPIQEKYQRRASSELLYIYNSIDRSSLNILVFAIIAIALIGGVGFLTIRQLNLALERDKAEAASKTKSEFLANMSHEIRTPLNGVMGFIDLLSSTRLDNRQMEFVSIAKRSANSLLDIINDILDFSKIEAGKLELSIERIDLPEMVAHAADLVKVRAEEKQLHLWVNLPASIPKFVLADPIRLRQVLMNLLSNAVKFTPAGEVEIKVESIDRSSSDQKLFQSGGKGKVTSALPSQIATFRFSVRDTGIGIAEENLEKIFKAFEQEDSSTTKKYGGTGLGLAICDKLLHIMGSTLHVKSEVGKGSTFYFDLQLKVLDENHGVIHVIRSQTNEATKIVGEALHQVQRTIISPFKKLSSVPNQASVKDMQHERSEVSKPNIHVVEGNSQTPQEAAPTARVKILIVDDNAFNRILAKSIVKGELPKAAIFEATNGRQAVELFLREKPDIIFMDIQMPEMNGYDATTEIRSIENAHPQNLKTRTPIIAITAGTVKGEREKCMEVGMDGYISKPIAQGAIQKAIGTWLTKRKLG